MGVQELITNILKDLKSYFPGEEIEYYYYDQLGSTLSDNPQIDDLWTIEHYVEEVEQVRKALGLNKDNFILLGHSWGGILGIEYALKISTKPQSFDSFQYGAICS